MPRREQCPSTWLSNAEKEPLACSTNGIMILQEEGEGRKGRKGRPPNVPRDPQPASSWNPLVSIDPHSHSATRESDWARVSGRFATMNKTGILLARKKVTVDTGISCSIPFPFLTVGKYIATCGHNTEWYVTTREPDSWL